MPRPPRRSKSRRAGYTEEHVRHLLHGVALCPGSGFRTHGHDHDEDAMKEAWEALRDTLMEEWVRTNPGRRPFCWWRYDSPEPRQRIDDGPHPFDNPDRQCRAEMMSLNSAAFRNTAYELFYGRPRALIVEDDFAARYEGELRYLDRLELLTNSERAELFT